jgi:eukaryotic-like serine/threonine-protein kinase
MQPEDLVGRSLGRYQITQAIGYGGMATVFLAKDSNLGRNVALKVFWLRGDTQAFLGRFEREARILAQLDHPNILPIYDYGQQDHMAYLVMPYIAGGTLKDVLQDHRMLPPSQAIDLLSKVLPALQYAHERGLIHRDIKPGNLLFKSDGTLILADFGVVKVAKSEGSLAEMFTNSGQGITGTPEYMAPEQIHGQVTPMSDIYSLGVVLYEMVTGVRPFTGPSMASILIKQLHETPRPPHEINPYISLQLERVILHALEKDPSKRFAQPVHFQQALEQIARSQPWQVKRPGSYPNQGETTVSLSEEPTIGSNGPTTLQQQQTQPPSVFSHRPLLPLTPSPITEAPTQSLQEGAPQTELPLRQPKRRKRTPLILLAIVILLLSGLVGSSFLISWPLNLPSLLHMRQQPVAQKPVPLITCPAPGTARTPIMDSITLGQHPNLVYVFNENHPTAGTLKRYDILTGNRSVILHIPNVSIGSAQISIDKQWILFTIETPTKSMLEIVRMDGAEQQTLYCSPAVITSPQWSADPGEQHIAFSVTQGGLETVYILTTATGELLPVLNGLNVGSGPSLIVATWLDYHRIFLTDQQTDQPHNKLYLLSIRDRADQRLSDLKSFANKPFGSFDTSWDGAYLYIDYGYCDRGTCLSSSKITVQPASGGGSETTLLDLPKDNVIGVHATMSINLLLIIKNPQGVRNSDTSHNGLWRAETQNSNPNPVAANLTPLVSDLPNESSSLNTSSQLPWSNISWGDIHYALLQTATGNLYKLSYGSLDGSPPTVIDQIDDGTVLSIAGWTTGPM